MSQSELVHELNSLGLAERLAVIESVLMMVRRELTMNQNLISPEQAQMKLAADALMVDYTNDKELMAFAALDPEDFYEAR
jgi:hypothetical protein